MQSDVSAGGIMGRVGGEGKLVTFAKKRLDFKFYLPGSWERDSDYR